MLDERIARVKELITQSDKIDEELSVLFNLEPRQIETKTSRRCSKCGETGHRASTCPQGKETPPLLPSAAVV